MSVVGLNFDKAQKLIKKGEIDSAKIILKNILLKYPQNVRIRKILENLVDKTTEVILPSEFEIKEMMISYENGEYEKTVHLAVAITERFQNYNLAWKVLGAAYLELKDYLKSEISFKKALQCNPNDHESLCNLGNLYQEIENFNDAEIYYKKSIELKEEYAEAYYNLAVLYADLNRSYEAEVNYRKAIKFKPDFSVAHSNLGSLLKDLKRIEDAELSYKKALEIEPNLAVSHYNIGLIQNDLGKYEEGMKSLQKAISLDTEYGEAFSELGRSFQALNKFDESEICYKKMLSIDPNISSIIVNKGTRLFNKKDYKEALVNFDLYNTEETRAKALECLYLMGQTDEIYNRIQKNSQIDEFNLNIAAFASFIEEKEKKPTANKFCPDPLNFIYYSNLTNHCKDMNDYISKIINELNYIPSIWENPSRPLKKGFQSNGDLFKNPKPNLDYLKSILIREINKYYEKFKNHSCTLIDKWPKKKNIKGWYVTLKEQGYQTSHIHPLGWLSGVIYLKVVPPLENNEGAIEFNLSGPNCYTTQSSKIIHNPKLGDIIFFPSSLYHRTIPFSTDSERIIISFDLQPDF